MGEKIIRQKWWGTGFGLSSEIGKRIGWLSLAWLGSNDLCLKTYIAWSWANFLIDISFGVKASFLTSWFMDRKWICNGSILFLFFYEKDSRVFCLLFFIFWQKTIDYIYVCNKVSNFQVPIYVFQLQGSLNVQTILGFVLFFNLFPLAASFVH